MIKNVRYLTGAFMVTAMLCGLYGCSSIDGSEDIGQGVIEAEDKKNKSGIRRKFRYGKTKYSRTECGEAKYGGIKYDGTGCCRTECC